MWSRVQKYEKYLKSENDIKRPLGPFNKELWAIYVFLKSSQILKPSTHEENYIKIKIGNLRSITHTELQNADSRCAPAYLFLPSGSSESPTPASAEGASYN